MKFLNYDKVLCLSPHPDDAEYGMLGTIMKYKDTKFDIVVLSQGGDFDCISDDIMSHEKLETHYKEKIESLEHQLAEMHKTYTEMALRIHTGK